MKKAIITCTNENVPEELRTLSKIYLDKGAGEKTFTWKADYMDSSGRHNTGFASYAQELYYNHPLDYYETPDAAIKNVGNPTSLGTYRK
jgi:hypothetical protein